MEVLSANEAPDKIVLVLTESTFGIVAKLAEQGQIKELRNFLSSVQNEPSNLLAKGLSIIKSPVVIRAAQSGQKDVVEYLSRSFSNIVCPTATKVWPLGASNSTALHEAAQQGHLDIVKFLIGAGVSVNCRKDHTGYTPLHSAVCSRKGGSQERIVQYLLNCGADVTALDIENKSPLYTAVHQIVCGVCGIQTEWLLTTIQLLLDSGADISQATVEGRSVFHLIACKNYSRTSQLVFNMLLQSKPDEAWKLLLTPSKGRDCTELCALLYAAEWKNKRLVDFITSQPQCPPDAAADALLALSTSSSSYPVQMVRELWERALQTRKRKKFADVRNPAEEYKKRVEVSNLDEVARLASVSSNATELHYQFLIMCERIFGQGSRAAVRLLWSLGHELCENSRFAEAERLFLRALKMTLLNLTGEYDQPGCYVDCDYQFSTFDREVQSLQKDIARMLSANHRPNLIQYAEYELKIAKHLLTDSASRLTPVLYQALSLLAAWSCGQQKLNSTAIIPEEISELGQELVTRCTTEQSLLTLVTSIATQKPHILSDERDHILFMADLILQWGPGSSINAMDTKGKRPLHVAVANSDSFCNGNTSGEADIVSLLVENGAHLDAIDSEGHTAYETCSDWPEPRAITALSRPLPLMCLASCSIVATHIPYADLKCIPQCIIDFIKLHDSNTKRTKFEHKMVE